MRRWGLVVLLGLASGCAKEREPAPTDLQELARYVFRNWEDPEAIAEAEQNLVPWLEELAGTEQGRMGLKLDPIRSGDVVDVQWPQDHGLTGMIGVAGAALSPHPVEAHADMMLVPDQAFLNPTNYARYEREIVDGDPTAFPGGEGMIRTDNDVETKSWGIKIPYELRKDYRWVEGTDTFLARCWVPERSCNDGGNTCLELTFSIDVWQGHGDETRRLTAGWTAFTSTISVGDDVLIAALAGGYQKVFETSDAYLDGER